VAKAWRKTFNLRLDALRHVVCRSMRKMAVSPKCLFPFRCPRGVKQALLGDEYKGIFRRLTSPDRLFCRSNLHECAPQVNRPGTCAFHGLPGNRAIKGKIDLEHPRTVAVALELTPVAGRQALTGQAQQL